MADNDTPPPSDTPAAKPTARRRNATPAKSAAAKPRATKPKTESANPAAANKNAVKAKAPPKPRSTKRGQSKTTTRRIADATTRATEKVGGGWAAAAIAGGLAVAGAATAALLTLRGSSAKPTDPAKGKGVKAHQPDGTDSSASFEAGIADEATIPDRI